LSVEIINFKIAFMKTKFFLMILSLAVITFSSCNKETAPLEQTSINLVDDNAVTDVAFDDVFTTVDNASIILETALGKGDLKSGTMIADSCPVVSVDNLAAGVWPKTITVNYGTGCTGFYGNTRSGKIIITVSARRNVTNSTRTVTFDNYYFNGIKVEGTKEIKNLGPNTNQNIVVSIKLTGGKLTLPGGKTIERAFDHQREWVHGWATKTIEDDEWLITGIATGKNINGIPYANTITTALHIKHVCEFPVSGVIKFERTGVDAVVLDYGTGECDAVATLKRGDQTKEIILKHKHRLMP
jgi:hypothetical protein